MWRDVLGSLGALVVAFSALYYLLDVLRGNTKPQRTSWALWATVGILGFGTSAAGGAGPGAWAVGVDAVACIVTFTVSLNPRFGKSGGSRFDPFLVLIGLAAIGLWRWGMLSMDVAALGAVACQLPALWPTVREAWRQPAYESLPSWSADVVGHTFAVAALAQFSVAAVAYPLYEFAATATVATVLVVRRRTVPRPVEHVEPSGLVDEREVWVRPAFVVGSIELPVVNAPAPWTTTTPAAVWPPASSRNSV